MFASCHERFEAIAGKLLEVVGTVIVVSPTSVHYGTECAAHKVAAFHPAAQACHRIYEKKTKVRIIGRGQRVEVKVSPPEHRWSPGSHDDQ